MLSHYSPVCQRWFNLDNLVAVIFSQIKDMVNDRAQSHGIITPRGKLLEAWLTPDIFCSRFCAVIIPNRSVFAGNSPVLAIEACELGTESMILPIQHAIGRTVVFLLY